MPGVLKIFTRYTALGASSRCRYYDYLPYFTAAGRKVVIHPFFPGAYLKRLYSCGSRSSFWFVFAMLRRLWFCFFLRGDVLLEYELLPFIPYRIERLLLRRCRYYVNFDDNVWEKYADRPGLQDKYDSLCRAAAGIIVANDFLFDKVRNLNSRVLKIPTAVKLEPNPPLMTEHPGFTIVWIGTPVTYKYIEDGAAMWRELARRIDYRLVIVAKRELEARRMDDVDMSFVDWSPEAERRELASADVGVMPLADDTFSRGKSAFKLIQYAAAGLPAVASPVGENNNVVINGVTGFLCADTDSFIAALCRLHDDPGLRHSLGRAAFKRAGEYSLDKFAPGYIGFVSE